MPQNRFRIQYLLALLLPLLFTYFAVQLFYNTNSGKTAPSAETVQPTLGPQYGNAELVAQNDIPQAPTKRGIDHLYVSLALALIAGLAAMLGHYLKTGLVWVAVLVSVLVLSLLGAKQLGIGLTLFFLPNIVLGMLLTLVIKYVFFNRELIRFRMLITSVAGAIILTLYYRVLHLLVRVPFQASDWQDKAVNALIIFIFITFGLTLADLVMSQLELRKQKLTSYFSNPEDDDEDAQ